MKNLSWTLGRGEQGESFMSKHPCLQLWPGSPWQQCFCRTMEDECCPPYFIYIFFIYFLLTEKRAFLHTWIPFQFQSQTAVKNPFPFFFCQIPSSGWQWCFRGEISNAVGRKMGFSCLWLRVSDALCSCSFFTSHLLNFGQEVTL